MNLAALLIRSGLGRPGLAALLAVALLGTPALAQGNAPSASATAAPVETGATIKPEVPAAPSALPPGIDTTDLPEAK